MTILIDADNVTVIQRETGEVLSEHTIEPNRNYHEGYRWHRLQRESPQCRLSVNPHMIA